VAPQVARAALEAGFIVNAVAPDAIRLAPPLILTAEQAMDAARFFATLAVEPVPPVVEPVETPSDQSEEDDA
jgi:acetylornithine aminotransferase